MENSLKILELHFQGVSYKNIGAKYNLTLKEVKEIVNRQKTNIIQQNELNENLSELSEGQNIRSNVSDLMTDLRKLYYEISDEYKSLTVKHSNIDKEIVDIYHYIEFYDLSASDGFKIYKMLQSELKKRREIKNQIEKLEILKGSLGSFKDDGHADKVLKKIAERQYSPRILKDLFSKKGF